MKTDFSSSLATAKFSKFAGILSAALSQHHLSGFEIAHQVLSLSWEDPVEKSLLPTPVLLPGEFHGQRSLKGYSPWGHKE